MWINLKFLYMWSNFNCSTWQMWRNILHYQKIMCAIYGVLLQNMFFAIYAVLSRNRFVAIYALLRGENLGQKLCPWRKNDKYEVDVWWCLVVFGACLVVSGGVNVNRLIWPELIDVYGQISLPVHVTDAAKMLMRWCWCTDAANAMLLLMHCCCWCADAAAALILLLRWCF